MNKFYRVVVDVREAVDAYYASFPNSEEARLENVAGSELENIMLEVMDNDYAVGNLREQYRHVIECNRHDGNAAELRWGQDTLRFGEHLVKIFRDYRLYDRAGALIGHYEFLVDNRFLCLFVDQTEEEEE